MLNIIAIDLLIVATMPFKDVESSRLAELFSKAPYAQRDQDEREHKQSHKVRPEGLQPGSFEHASPHYGDEMINRV